MEECVAYIATNAAKTLADAFNEKLMMNGITRVQWVALYYLGRFKSISQVELAEKMNIKSSTMVRLIDRMEKEEYVRRERDVVDRRIINLVLTKKGKELRKKLLPEGEKFSNLVSKGISDEEIKIFGRVLEKMVQNINCDEM